jgi:mono/diheme cytochrome c family protein
VVIAIVLLVTHSKKEYYLVRGKKNYEKHCANCHGKNGEGLQLLIPPLTDPVWLNNDSIVCIIKNGMDGSITVNGKNYNGRMPMNETLDEDEIADLVNYIRYDFTKSTLKMTISQVNTRIINCK